jgi:hypothetical protein
VQNQILDIRDSRGLLFRHGMLAGRLGLVVPPQRTEA